MPVSALRFAEIVSCELPVVITGFGLKLAVTPEGSPETLSVTELLAPTADTTTVPDLLKRRLTVIDTEPTVKLPAGGLIVSDTVVECTPEFPEIVNLTVPVGDELVVVIDRVDVPEPLGIVVGLSVQVVFAGHPLSVKETGLLNPFSGVTVIVELPPFPCVTVTDVGLAESEKSGGGLTVRESMVV